MKRCLNCKHAVWERTSVGKLHPSGNGMCTYGYRVPMLPASMYWIGRTYPVPHGGYIKRKETLKEDCVYFNRADKQ